MLLLLHTKGGAQEPFAIELEDPDPTHGSCFGCAVAIDGDYAFVGEPGSLVGIGGVDPAGEVHVYHRNEGGLNAWGFVQTLIPDEPSEIGFGYDLAIVGGQLAVLRPTHIQHFFDVPIGVFRALYFFKRGESGWARSHIISNSTYTPTGYMSSVGATLSLSTYRSIDADGSRIIVADGGEFLRLGTGPPSVEGFAWQYEMNDEGVFVFSAILYPTTIYGHGRLVSVSGNTTICNQGSMLRVGPPLYGELFEAPEVGSNAVVYGNVTITSSTDLLLIGVPDSTPFTTQGGVVYVRDLGMSDLPLLDELLQPTSVDDDRFGRIMEDVHGGFVITGSLFLHVYRPSNGSLVHSFSIRPFDEDGIAAVAGSEDGDLIVGSSVSGRALIYPAALPTSTRSQFVKEEITMTISDQVLVVQFPEGGSRTTTMLIADQLGRTIANMPCGGVGSVAVNLAGWAAGTYICSFPGAGLRPMRFVR